MAFVTYRRSHSVKLMSDIFISVQQTLDTLESDFAKQLDQAVDMSALEQLRVAFLGRKSELTAAMKQLPNLAPDQRGVIGKRANILKSTIKSQLKKRRESLDSQPERSSIDVTFPGTSLVQGRLHPITQTLGEIVSVFTSMGFEIIEGPEIEFEYYNFDALNIPKEHPSRESFDTFFLDLPSPDPKKGKMLLRSHTSPVQIRVMEKRKPPLRIVVPGKVYRPDQLDPGHSFMFHQVEGLMVDSKTSFTDLKGVLDYSLKQLFGSKTKTRFRPHYFPFTEPSAEVDIACSSCDGKGCSTCGRKGWVEIMGCGMVHPNVFKGVGYDTSKVQGFAFGMGVERICMLKYGVKDIRLFFENDLRFLEQF